MHACRTAITDHTSLVVVVYKVRASSMRHFFRRASGWRGVPPVDLAVFAYRARSAIVSHGPPEFARQRS